MGWTFYNSNGEALIQNAESEATQAEMEAETAGAKFVPPDLVRNSPGVAKAWAYISVWGGGSASTLADSYNVDSAADDGAGLTTLTWTTDFATEDTYINGGWSSEGRIVNQVGAATQAVGSSQFTVVVSDSGSRTDAVPTMIIAWGDQ